MSENLAESYKHDLHVYIDEEINLFKNYELEELKGGDKLISNLKKTSMIRQEYKNGLKSQIAQEIN